MSDSFVLPDNGYGTADKNRLKDRLRHWFRFDHLDTVRGISLLIGVDPDEWSECLLDKAASIASRDFDEDAYEEVYKARKAGLTLLDGREISTLPPVSVIDYLEEIGDEGEGLANVKAIYRGRADSEIGRFFGEYQNLLTYWNSGNHPEITTPLYFVFWAQYKGFGPEWLAVAEDMGLVPKPEEVIDAPAIEDKPLSQKSETTYLNIIGVLLEYVSGSFPGVEKHPSFKNETALIALIDEKFKGIGGLSASNLSRKFPKAKKSLSAF